jgi:hypothetical protein
MKKLLFTCMFLLLVGNWLMGQSARLSLCLVVFLDPQEAW